MIGNARERHCDIRWRHRNRIKTDREFVKFARLLINRSIGRYVYTEINNK